jgi:hypothetical protein
MLIERRKRSRLPLICSLQLYRRRSDQPIDGETLNINSEGFYCFVQEPFTLGETLSCILNVPSESVLGETAAYSTGRMKLKCNVEVLRVDSIGLRFGVAFRIKNFTVTRRD